MENRFLDKLSKIISIKVKGKNIYYFVNKVIKKNIKIYDLIIINYKEAIIKIKYEDYVWLEKNKTIYEIEKMNNYGTLWLIEHFKKYYIFMFFIMFGLVTLFFLSNVIFDIEVVHSNSEVRNLIYKELKRNGIDKYIIKKSYSELEGIEENILNNNQTKIEWIEINRSGTKYIVRVEERKINDKKEEILYQDVIAKKSGVITKVIASSGEIVKNTNDYVKEGDVVISGSIVLPNNTKSLTKAMGRVYAEVWYVVDISYPYIYKEERLTGKSKKVYLLQFLNRRISFFDFNKYNNYKVDDEIVFSDKFKIVILKKEKQYEMIVIDEVITKEEAYNKAIDKAIRKISDAIKEDESIIKYKVLEVIYNEQMVKLKIFFSVNEEISDVRKINLEIE